MSKENYIPLRDLISESFLRDLVLFLFLFLLVISQGWDNIVLLLFPVITFGFSIFFNLIHVNKWRTEFEEKHLVFNPLGSEKKNANRFFFCALFQLILLFWIGAESLYHPQLIDNYAFFFILIYVFSYTFSFYWIFIDLGKYARIEILIDGVDLQYIKQDYITSKNVNHLMSFLELNYYRKISIINFSVFIILNVLNILTAFLNIILNIEIFQFYLNLPGTGIEDSLPLSLSYCYYVILIVSPLIMIQFLKAVYAKLTSIDKGRLNSVLSQLPRDVQIKVIENLKTLNNRIKEELKLE